MDRIGWAALEGSRTVVELGCGFGVVLKQLVRRGYRAHGVDIWQPYLDYVHVVAPGATWECCDGLEWCEAADDASWDAVAMVDFIEHVPRDAGAEILEHTTRIARRAVVIYGPDGYVAQRAEESIRKGTPGVPDMFNPYEEHLAGWSADELEALGFRCRVRMGNRGYNRVTAAWTR